jgi:hypothetical protein
LRPILQSNIGHTIPLQWIQLQARSVIFAFLQSDSLARNSSPSFTTLEMSAVEEDHPLNTVLKHFSNIQARCPTHFDLSHLTTLRQQTFEHPSKILLIQSSWLNVCLCLIKHHVINIYGRDKVWFYLFIYLSTHLWLCTPCGPWPFIPVSQCYAQSVRSLGRRNSLSQGRCLHTEQHKHRINAHRHQCLDWVSNPRSQC